MSLILAQALPTGISAKYHKIESIDLNSGNIVVSLFISKETREAGAIPVNGYEVKSDPATLFSEESLSPQDATPKKVAYAYLKTLPNELNPTVNFSGAVDA